jgi:hypothetical protein
MLPSCRICSQAPHIHVARYETRIPCRKRCVTGDLAQAGEREAFKAKARTALLELAVMADRHASRGRQVLCLVRHM